MKYIIYQIQNKINNKNYIGFSSKSVEKRWSKHCVDAKNGRNTYLCNAIRKYGTENFDTKIIHCCDNLDLAKNFLEQHYIKNLKSYYLDGNGYNMTLGGEGTIGHKHSNETKIKMSKSHTGRKHSDETKLKLSLQRTGVGNPNYGRDFSQEHKEKLGLASKGALNPRAKKFHVTLPDGKCITIDDRKGFCEQNNLKYFSVVSSIKRNTSYQGYTFKEITEES